MKDQTIQDLLQNGTAAATVVSVAFPAAVPGLFDYRIPAPLSGTILPGTPVLVELRNRRIWGVAIAVKPRSDRPSLKEVISARSRYWTGANRPLIELYEWVAAYYHCELGRVFRPLVNKGIAASGAKKITVYTPLEGGAVRLSSAQEAAAAAIAAAGCSLSKHEIAERLGITSSVVDSLYKKGYLGKEQRVVLREVEECTVDIERSAVTLSGEQAAAVETMAALLKEPDRPFLLHGITGSGKTHVYTELARRVLALGRCVIILVPEISLTPQTIMRFRAAVGDCISVIHSNMSDGERRDSLRELVTGGKRLVIGVRSAVLAPMDKVGLIIVDEEHDASYKQTESDPRYHARDVAIMRGRFQKALVVLGSATPSLESWHNAQTGKYRLVSLRERFGPARLPQVRTVDMTLEHRAGNWTVVSRLLEARIRECLSAGRQIILLLNRRGYSTVLICKECGYTHLCPCCSVTLRYHLNDHTLKCHICGHEAAAPDTCPVCRGEQMKYQGTGIQKAEEAIRGLFPHVRIVRMDRDTTRRKGAHHAILDTFAKRKADILIGTQMVAKGLDFPGVALVGVLQADTGLLFPDFRASERTFQLLTQVAGRAGRGDSIGEVVLQTYHPDDPAIRAATSHDYLGFCDTELPCRRELDYPPFAKLARVVLSGPVESQVRAEMAAIGRSIAGAAHGVIVLGPSPAVLSKISNEFRYSLLLKSSSPRKLSNVLGQIRGYEIKLPKKMRLIIDVDPVYML